MFVTIEFLLVHLSVSSLYTTNVSSEAGCGGGGLSVKYSMLRNKL